MKTTMEFDKEELEIIGHALTLIVDEMTHEENKTITESMLGRMQFFGIWGMAELHIEE
tara:strand:+ start:26805 stop:26978 length:174 start_codon:yes stop_codon:yes gene_type:complete